MRWFRFAVLVIIIMILQYGLVDIFALAGVKFDLLLILLVFFAVYCNTTEAIIISFAIGFAADIIGPAMGPQFISFGLFGTLLAYIHRVVAIRKMRYQAIMIVLVGFVAGTLALLLTLLKNHSLPPKAFVILCGTAFYSALIGPFLFLPAAWWMRIRTHRFTPQ